MSAAMKSLLDLNANGDAFFNGDVLFNTFDHLFNLPEEVEKALNAPLRTYMQDRKAMAGTAVDIKERSNGYTFFADMPGLTRSDIQVQVEDENILSIRGKRKREDDSEEGVKIIRLERKPAKFLRKFTLPADANVDSIKASCKDGVLIVEVPKNPPPEPEKPKIIEVPIS